jgi:tight adherence protein B
MAFVLATFGIVLGIILGIYWLLLVRPETAEDSAVLARVGRTTKAAKAVALLKGPQRLSDMHSLDYLLARAGRLVDPLQRSIDQSGLKVTLGTMVLASALSAALAFYLVHTFLHLLLVAAVVGGLAACVPFAYVRHTRSRRLLKFEEQFPEAIDLLARALRAGHAITTGLAMVAEELPDPIGPEFQTLYDQQNFGLPLSQALKNFADRVVILDARFFVTAVLTQKESGGNLSEVLDNLGSIIRERFKVKRQVRVISAHGRMTGWVLSAIPVSLGLFFAISNPEKYASFYRDPLGMQLIGGALCLQLIGVFIMKKIVNIEY